MVADVQMLSDIGDGAGKIDEAKEKVAELREEMEKMADTPNAMDGIGEVIGGIGQVAASTAMMVGGLKTAFSDNASVMERITGVVAAAGAAYSAFKGVMSAVKGI